MKLSMLSTEQGADALIAITPEIEPILIDPEFMEIFSGTTTDKAKAAESGAKRILRLVPVMLGKYRQNMFRIIAILNGKTQEEVAEQKLTETIKQIVEIFRDKELLDFFQSLKPSAQSK